MSEEKTAIKSLIRDIHNPNLDDSRALLDNDGSYRSQIFNANSGVNDLVTAAQPLLSMIGRLHHADAVDVDKHFNKNLLHEVKSFEARALDFEYTPETILIARYLLSCALDESVDVNANRGYDTVESVQNIERLLPVVQSEEESQEGFFKVLDKTLEDPHKHVDLLELMYLLMSAGHQGKYRTAPEGSEQLAALNTTLYDNIRNTRGTFKKSLFLDKDKLAAAPAVTSQRSHFPWWSLPAAALSLALVYLGLQGVLHLSTLPLQDQLQHIVKNVQTISQTL